MPVRILICTNRRQGEEPSCAGRDSESLVPLFETAAAGRVTVDTLHCLGHCAVGPTVRVAPGGGIHTGVTAEDVDPIVAEAVALAEGGRETN